MKFTLLGVCTVLMFVACSKDDDNNGSSIVTTQDSMFLVMASQINHAEVDAGAIATVHADADTVAVYGAKMVAAHSPAQDTLENIAAQTKVTVPAAADSAHQAFTVQLLSLTGHVFDTTYMGAQLRDHAAAIVVFQDEINNGTNASIKQYAADNLPIIQMHYIMAQETEFAIQ